MKRNNFFSRFIVVTLTAALLLFTGSRAIPVFALADPVAVSPVFDTQIYQLADYATELPEPSLDVFYLLTGVLVASQLGGQEYKLEDPYANSSDVVDWFKSLGIRFYNTVIGLYPNQDPILGFDVRPYIKPIVAAMMGNAVLARNYNGVDDLLNSDDDVLVPFNREIQDSINVIWQIQGGPFDWQFDTTPFETQGTYNSIDLTIPNQNSYDSWTNGNKTMRINYPNQAVFNGWTNVVYKSSVFNTYHNLFLDESTFTFYLCDDSGNKYINNNASIYCERAYLRYGTFTTGTGTFDCPYLSPVTFNSGNYSTYVAAVQAYFNQQIHTYSTFGFFDFIDHVYVGTNWINKHEIFNIQGLNIDDTGNDYYETPTDTDLLIDIKNLITDLVGDTDIWTNIINNVYDPDGTHVVGFPTIRVSVDLTPITELLAPPVPVNMNDIAELTDNTYLERLKEHARNAGDIFANYVAFWHNVDSDIVYTMFGAVILVLVGAFIGKWGHS